MIPTIPSEIEQPPGNGDSGGFLSRSGKASEIKKSDADRAATATNKLKRSSGWMADNFYSEWEHITRQYYAVPMPRVDPNSRNGVGNSTDTSRYHGLFGPNGQLLDSEDANTGIQTLEHAANFYIPDQWALVRRKAARATNAIPNLTQRGGDYARARRNSRTLMWQWDSMGRKRDHKKHVATAVLCGWSVKSWFWVRNESMRTDKVDMLRAKPEQLIKVFEYYQSDVQQIQQEYLQEAAAAGMFPDPAALFDDIDQLQRVIGGLQERYGIGKYIRYRYPTLGYVGPKFDTVFLPYVFPQPNFSYIQDSKWFGMVRRRDRGWFERLKAAYEWMADERGSNPAGDNANAMPLNLAAIDEMMNAWPKGSDPSKVDTTVMGNNGRMGLLDKMLAATNRVATSGSTGTENSDEDDAEWTVLEIHYPGDEPTVEYVAEGKYWLGRLPYTFDLGDGMIPVTDLVFADSFLGGVGDSSSRIIRNLVEEHGRQASLRNVLVHDVLRPMARARTGSPLFDSPDLIKRGPFGLRLIECDDDIKPLQDQNALAAISAGMQNDNTFARDIQYATGESNMSTMANVDPAQARTATGARIMAFNQDILSQDELNMLNISIYDDANIMRRLMRSELVDELQFDSSPYLRGRDQIAIQMASQPQGQGQPGQPPSQPSQAPAGADPVAELAELDPSALSPLVTTQPEDWQIDGDIEPEAGSTLADDDELNVHRAQLMWQIAKEAGGQINIGRALQFVLTSIGQAKHLGEWIVPPNNEPVPPPPAMARWNANINLSVKDYMEALLAGGVPKENAIKIVDQLIVELMSEREPKSPNEVGGDSSGAGSSSVIGAGQMNMLEAPGARGPDTAYEAGAGGTSKI